MQTILKLRTMGSNLGADVETYESEGPKYPPKPFSSPAAAIRDGWTLVTVFPDRYEGYHWMFSK